MACSNKTCENFKAMQIAGIIKVRNRLEFLYTSFYGMIPMNEAGGFVLYGLSSIYEVLLLKGPYCGGIFRLRSDEGFIYSMLYVLLC